MRSEFKRGDVIIRIDGNIKYVVVGFYLSFMWYRLLLWMDGRWHRSEMRISEVDKWYVKIDTMGEDELREIHEIGIQKR